MKMPMMIAIDPNEIQMVQKTNAHRDEATGMQSKLPFLLGSRTWQLSMVSLIDGQAKALRIDGVDSHEEMHPTIHSRPHSHPRLHLSSSPLSVPGVGEVDLESRDRSLDDIGRG